MRALTVILAGLTTGLFVACGGGTGANKSIVPAKKIWTEDELLSVVKGKTPSQVIAAIGRPNGTSGGDPDKDYEAKFIYNLCLHNPHTGKANDAWIVFQNGVAVSVRR